jgi:hypothetical protein
MPDICKHRIPARQTLRGNCGLLDDLSEPPIISKSQDTNHGSRNCGEKVPLPDSPVANRIVRLPPWA